MSGIRLLHCVDRQSANRVDAKRVQLGPGHNRLFTRHHVDSFPEAMFCHRHQMEMALTHWIANDGLRFQPK